MLCEQQLFAVGGFQERGESALKDLDPCHKGDGHRLGLSSHPLYQTLMAVHQQ